MLIGYARVSTNDRETAAQVAALKGAGCERIYRERPSISLGNPPRHARNVKPGYIPLSARLGTLVIANEPIHGPFCGDATADSAVRQPRDKLTNQCR